jgi:NAD(P)-dependent dehydrogenase (short-subunit alcohol dehydrogenase family)
MVDSIVTKWGGIDILINNAGAAQRKKGAFDELESDDFVALLNLNVVAVHRVTSAVVKSEAMTQGGRIINISSKAGKIGIPNMSFYVASKFALEGLTATMAIELKDRGITVNSISPGMVNTQSFPKPDGKPGVRTAESIADGLFALLESDVTGHYLHVDELDAARAQGLDDSAALKSINETAFLG